MSNRCSSSLALSSLGVLPLALPFRPTVLPFPFRNLPNSSITSRSTDNGVDNLIVLILGAGESGRRVVALSMSAPSTVRDAGNSRAAERRE